MDKIKYTRHGLWMEEKIHPPIDKNGIDQNVIPTAFFIFHRLDDASLCMCKSCYVVFWEGKPGSVFHSER